tara:strand:+ start:15174 stop:15392 length:219 start_codon:yes stop_codon:yes gene_type:complete
MKRLEALGLKYHTECKMCGTKKEKQKLYNLYPHPAAINLLVDTSPIAICVKCVKRELGTKNLEELHELEKVR